MPGSETAPGQERPVNFWLTDFSINKRQKLIEQENENYLLMSNGGTVKREDNHTIAYAYNVGDTIERFNKCTPQEQSSIEARIAKVIIESFLEPADDDYLAARSLAIGGLYRSFFWSGAQAVEKYLKTYLLLHGVSVIPFSRGHELGKLLTAAEMVTPGFIHIDLAPHPTVELPAHFPLSHFKLDSFIATLEKYGSPNNRYNNYGAIYDTGHLFALDTLAHHLRNKMQVPRIEESFHRNLSADFKRYLYENNPYFAPVEFTHATLPNPLFPLTNAMHVTQWEFLLKRNDMQFLFPRQWLQTHMKIS